MRTILTATIVLVLLGLAGAVRAEDLIKPGQEGALVIEGYPTPCVMYIPSDYAAGAQMPLIMHMHGAGGQPTTIPFRQATDGKGYIVVGLSYGPLGLAKEGITATPEMRTQMIAYFAKVREKVKATYGLNEKQVYLSGLSMGGWGVNYFGFHKDSKGLYRAYCIIAAGPLTRDGVDLSVAKGVPVMILNGGTDPNLQAANEGLGPLKQAGAVVTQEIIAG
ncbi:MAG: hypothetical protein ABIF71_06265 [Planctomycetota bacterium]